MDTATKHRVLVVAHDDADARPVEAALSAYGDAAEALVVRAGDDALATIEHELRDFPADELLLAWPHAAPALVDLACARFSGPVLDLRVGVRALALA